MLAVTSYIYQTCCMLGSTQIHGHAYARCGVHRVNVGERKMGLGLVM